MSVHQYHIETEHTPKLILTIDINKNKDKEMCTETGFTEILRDKRLAVDDRLALLFCVSLWDFLTIRNTDTELSLTL